MAAELQQAEDTRIDAMVMLPLGLSRENGSNDCQLTHLILHAKENGQQQRPIRELGDQIEKITRTLCRVDMRNSTAQVQACFNIAMSAGSSYYGWSVCHKILNWLRSSRVEDSSLAVDTSLEVFLRKTNG